jgi:Spy/CpxP family protein refolding chaperone
MDQKRKNVVLIAIACLLLCVAGYRFWPMAMEARSRAGLSGDPSYSHPKVVSNIGPRKPDPFQDLALTDEQRRKIDDILKASLPPLPPPGQGGSGKPHFVKVVMPMDKIDAVLTPAQREKFRRLRAERQNSSVGMPGGGPNPSGPQLFLSPKDPP